MYKEFYATSELLNWPLVGLGLFFLSFLGVLAYVFFGLRQRGTLERVAALPLLDDDTATTNDEEGEGRG